MKYFLVCLLFFAIVPNGITQKSFFKDFESNEGLNFYDLDFSSDTLVVIAGSIFRDQVGIGDEFVAYINGNNGSVYRSIPLSFTNHFPFKLNSSLDSGFIYLFSFDPRQNEEDSIIIYRINSSSEQMAFTSHQMGMNITTGTWLFEKDSILLTTFSWEDKKFNYKRIGQNTLSGNDTLYSNSEIGPTMDIWPSIGNNGNYLLFAYEGLRLWDETNGSSIRLLKDTLFSFGKITYNSKTKEYVVFGRGIDENTNKGVQLSLVKLDSNFNYVKRVMFGEGFPSYDYPAIVNSISQDEEHYFVAAHIDISSDAYTSTTPKSFYVGKYDDDLNEAWLHILGGDRHYFISGVEADKEGGCYVYGFSRSANYNFEAIPFLMRLNADGMITSTEPGPSEQYHLTLYGNPGKEAMRFGFGSAEVGFQMQLLDLQGKLVGAREVHQGIQEINMAHAPAGMYIWQLYNHAGILVNTGKWMKAE